MLRFLALRDLGNNFASRIVIRRHHRLVRHGIYSLVRHPLHLGLLCEIFGMALLSGKVWLFSIWLIMIPIVVRRNNSEDEVLRVVFGERARVYQAAVPAMNIVGSVLKSYIHKIGSDCSPSNEDFSVSESHADPPIDATVHSELRRERPHHTDFELKEKARHT